MPSNEEIAAAALRLLQSDIRGKIDRAAEEYSRGAHHTLPVFLPHIEDILLIAEQGARIAEALKETESFVSSETK